MGIRNTIALNGKIDLVTKQKAYCDSIKRYKF